MVEKIDGHHTIRQSPEQARRPAGGPQTAHTQFGVGVVRACTTAPIELVYPWGQSEPVSAIGARGRRYKHDLLRMDGLSHHEARNLVGRSISAMNWRP